jgi:hypothetical protein
VLKYKSDRIYRCSTSSTAQGHTCARSSFTSQLKAAYCAVVSSKSNSSDEMPLAISKRPSLRWEGVKLPQPFVLVGGGVPSRGVQVGGAGVLPELPVGEGVLSPLKGVGASVSDPGPPPLLSKGGLVVSATGATVGGGDSLELSSGKGGVSQFEGVGTSPSVPDPPPSALSEGTLVASAPRKTEGGDVLPVL